MMKITRSQLRRLIAETMKQKVPVFPHVTADEMFLADQDKYLQEMSDVNPDQVFKQPSEESILGKWVWPSALKSHSMIDEPDTEIEEMLYQQLHNHFGAIAPLNDDAISALQQILASGEYAEIFVPCKTGPILRGMRLPVTWLEQNTPEAISALTDKEKDPVDWDPAVDIEPFVYKPEGKYGNVSSWTNDWMAARRFTTHWSPDTVPVILHSDCSTGYFMHTQSFARYKGGRYRDEFDIRKLNPQGKSEKEILLFGECYVTAVQVNITKQDYERLKSDHHEENNKQIRY